MGGEDLSCITRSDIVITINKKDGKLQIVPFCEIDWHSVLHIQAGGNDSHFTYQFGT